MGSGWQSWVGCVSGYMCVLRGGSLDGCGPWAVSQRLTLVITMHKDQRRKSPHIGIFRDSEIYSSFQRIVLFIWEGMKPPAATAGVLNRLKGPSRSTTCSLGTQCSPLGIVDGTAEGRPVLSSGAAIAADNRQASGSQCVGRA